MIVNKKLQFFFTDVFLTNESCKKSIEHIENVVGKSIKVSDYKDEIACFSFCEKDNVCLIYLNSDIIENENSLYQVLAHECNHFSLSLFKYWKLDVYENEEFFCGFHQTIFAMFYDEAKNILNNSDSDLT